MNKPTTPTPATTTEKHLTAEEKVEIDRNFDGMAQAFAKAEELHRLFIRFSEMAATPKERAEIDRFLESMRRGESGLGLAYDALLLGAKCGRDPAKDAEIQQSQKRLADEMARLADEQAKANEQTALALRYAKTMEDAARDATDRPDRVGGEIVRMVWDQLEAKEKDIAIKLQQNNGNMYQTADKANSFSTVRRCRERLRLLYAGAKMALPAWLWNRYEIEEHKRKQDANPGWISPSGDFVRTNPNDADDMNNF
jgi:hypothetical protein